MKKIAIIFCLWGYFISFALSQDEKHVNSGDFVKRIGYNLLDIQLVTEVGDELKHTGYQCNLDSKTDVEKLFFGEFNAPVEFFYNPSFEASTKGASGFRIVRDSLKSSYVFEIKHISNHEKVYREVWDRYSTMVNSEEKYKFVEKEQIKLFKVETLSYLISDQFAEKLYKKMVSLIDNFKAKGVSPIIVDGYSVTFRTVVDDEVWSLWIHMPQGNALKMADLCRQIITDAETNTFEESKYVELLTEI
ncbi:MAG: hypothetical protein LBL13_13195 [Bacteroidales bacterium]|jgi:hypothetical protein|nr:hypothetical protein [Bacteroidales bacterium]